MRRVNEAWAVLGDPARRRRYDAELAASARDGSGPTPRTPRVTHPSDAFVPHRPDTAEDPDEDDSWRFEPDEGDPASVPPTVLLAAPPAVCVRGAGLLVAAVASGGSRLVAAGFVCLRGCALCFVGARVVALCRSQLTEDRAGRRRG